MPTVEDVQHQRGLIDTYRRNLALYLRQKASLGPNQISTGQENGILEARTHIARIKKTLRSWGVQVQDHPDDFEPQPSPMASVSDVSVKISADKVMLVIPLSDFGRLIVQNPELLNYVVYKS